MNRPRIARALRIAWTAFWAIAAFLLLAMWVRSYWWIDDAIGPISSTHVLVLGSDSGRFIARVDKGERHPTTVRWQLYHTPLAMLQGEFSHPNFAKPQFGFSGTNPNFYLADWLATIAAVIFATLPWIMTFEWRFGLRTLLIATTLVAVALGLVDWLTR
jgi:hypothetical protein